MIDHGDHELKTGLGMNHFEARSSTGFQPHLTLVAEACLFATRRLLSIPKTLAGQPELLRGAKEIQRILVGRLVRCPACNRPLQPHKVLLAGRPTPNTARLAEPAA